ncbi:hypothetical protein vseg_020523 [Gypsophila vaccaria]
MITGSTGSTTSSNTLGSDYESPQENESSNIGGFTYGLGVTVGILVLITTITVTSYFCSRDPGPSPAAEGRPQGHQQQGRDHVIDVEGIDEETLKSYPKCLYSQLEKKTSKKESSTQNSCSICLGNYKGSDLVRELGECGHVFHLKCVDSWLKLHPTCPLCRTSPLPTPQSTPLAQVVVPLISSSLRGG